MSISAKSVGWEPDRVCRLGGGPLAIGLRVHTALPSPKPKRSDPNRGPYSARATRGCVCVHGVPCRVIAEIEPAFKKQANRDLAVWRRSTSGSHQMRACVLLGVVLRGRRVCGRRGFIRRRAPAPAPAPASHPAPACLRFVISSSAPRQCGSVCAPVSDSQRPGPAPAESA